MYDTTERDLGQPYNYQVAFKYAREELTDIDIRSQCIKSGARIVRDNEQGLDILLAFLNQEYIITYPQGEISFNDGSEEVPIWEKILLLHYLITARGTPLKGEFISFNQVKDGRFYYQNFLNRTTKPLAGVFGKEPGLLLTAGEDIGGRRADYGDFSITIPALPRIDITIIIWAGDEEFPPDVNMVFDPNITDYLPTEDIVVLCNMVAVKLIKTAKNVNNKSSGFNHCFRGYNPIEARSLDCESDYISIHNPSCKTQGYR